MESKKPEEMRSMVKSGIILLDKGENMTSQSAVTRVKRLLGVKTAGHTGTLDPLATGLLPVCFGRATRAAGYITDGAKRYTALLRTGLSTDTDDITGNVLEMGEPLSREKVEAAASEFIGAIEQVPPMYSAIKKDGKKLYELAREGITLELEPRRIEIYSIDIIDTPEEGDLLLDIRCSKGTYIRSLCRDISARAGGLGCMAALRRTETGGFDISSAVTLEEISSRLEEGDDGFILPISEAFADLPEVYVKAEAGRLVRFGADIPSKLIICGSERLGPCRLYVEGEGFIALARNEGRFIHTEKSFYEVD